MCADGALIHADGVVTGKIAGRNDADNDDDSAYETIGWYSGQHYCFCGNLQVLSNRDGRPLYIAPVEPRATHDISAAKSIFLMPCGAPGYI